VRPAIYTRLPVGRRTPTVGSAEGVPFARGGAHLTGDFEDLVGWLATSMNKTALCRLVRIT